MKKWVIWMLVILGIGAIALLLNLYDDCKPQNSPESLKLGQVNSEIISELENSKSANQLFYEEESSLTFSLGFDKTAQIVPGTGRYDFIIAGMTYDGRKLTNNSQLQYKIFLKNETDGCPNTRNLFVTSLDSWQDFQIFKNDKAFTVISLNVPKSAENCSQKVFVQIKDEKYDGRTLPGNENVIAQSVFTIKVSDNWECRSDSADMIGRIKSLF